jgi:hypothetical protein
MFEEATISRNADFSKDKKNIYRYHKLSKDDKKSLYADRPDLDPKGVMASNIRPSPITTVDCLNAPLLDKEGDRRTRRAGGGGGDDIVEEERTSSNESSKHSIVVLGDLMCDDVGNPLHVGLRSSSSHSNRLEEGLGEHLTDTDGESFCEGVDASASSHFDPRHSTDLLLTSEERNSLGMNLLHPCPGGSAVKSTEDFSNASHSAVSVIKLLSHSRQSQSTAGEADEWDESSDDESDEEDEALNAPV